MEGTLAPSRPRVAVVTPFLDKRHGSERCLAEQIGQLKHTFEIHLFTSRVDDIDLTGLHWHRVPWLPAPQLLAFLWWLGANTWVRHQQQRRLGVRFDLTYSAGLNCLDADVITVHIVFADLLAKGLGAPWSGTPLMHWPRQLHRWLYYQLLRWLEHRAYRSRDTLLLPISHRTQQALRRHFGRQEPMPVLYHGVDRTQFHPDRRRTLRASARAALGLAEEEFTLLLIGNDARSKGFDLACRAIELIPAARLCLLICSGDPLFASEPLPPRARLLSPRPDIEFYYAAADALLAPSRQDAFNLPVLEAMACGLPVIVSHAAGVSELLTDGTDALILDPAEDTAQLAALIQRLYRDEALRRRLGCQAAETAQRFSWEANAAQLASYFWQRLSRRSCSCPCPSPSR